MDKSRLRIAWIALLLAMALAPARAQEDCVQCKHVDCLKGLMKQKTALANGYDALSRKWDRLVLVEGAPADVANFNAITDTNQRAEFYRSLLDKHRIFAQQEDEMASQVGPPAGCGFTPGLSAETDTYETCKIDEASLSRAKSKAPCQQIGDLLARHEGLHRKQCLARKDGRGVGDFWRYTATGRNGANIEKYFPPLMQTPAGRAREEAVAYRMEIAALKKLLEQAKKKCEYSFKDVTISCKLQGAEMGQDIAGRVCGDPVAGTWTIRTVSWARIPHVGLQRNVDPPWDNDCVAKGSAEERRREAIYSGGPGGGWMCVFEDGDRPKVIIRNFRLPQCSPNIEQTITVEAERSECETEPQAPETLSDPDVPVS